MKLFKLEINLFILSSISFIIWYLKSPIWISFLIYGSLFIYFIYKQKPIEHYLITILFSVTSRHQCGINILIDYNLILFLFCYTIYYVIKEKRLVLGNLFFPLLIYALYNTISLLWTPNLSNGIDGLFAILEGYIVYFILTNRMTGLKDTISISKIASFLMLTVTFEIITLYVKFGMFEIIKYKHVLHLGWAMSNIMATVYVFLIPIALYKYLNHKKFSFYVFIDFLNLIGLILTLSRGAYLGLFVSILLFTVVFIRKRLILYYGTAMIFFFLILCQFKNKLSIFIKGYLNNRLIFDSSSREPIYSLAWKSFKNNIFFGEGVKSSEYMLKEYLGIEYSHYHNFIIQIAATLGIVGIILFIWIIYQWIKILDKKNPFIYCVTFSIIGTLTHQLFDVSFDLYFFGVIFYSLISLVEVYRHFDINDSLKMKIIDYKT